MIVQSNSEYHPDESKTFSWWWMNQLHITWTVLILREGASTYKTESLFDENIIFCKIKMAIYIY